MEKFRHLLLPLAMILSGCTLLVMPEDRELEPLTGQQAGPAEVQRQETVPETEIPVQSAEEPLLVISPVTEARSAELPAGSVDTEIEPAIENSVQDQAPTLPVSVEAPIDQLVQDLADTTFSSDSTRVPESSPLIDKLCSEIGNKLGSVTVSDCLSQQLRFDGAYSVNSRPLTIRDFQPVNGDADVRVLILGGIHGDEYSSISIMFKWMEILAGTDTDFYWRFLPATNPDGLLDGQAARQNANGVDLNRNFPTRDWLDLAKKTWIENTSRNERRFPGEGPGSEPEVQWLVRQIEVFKPDVIVSVHAPYHLLDFDGPLQAPDKIGELYLHQLGVYPGSLGNYGGIDLGIPVVTLELPSAGIMPAKNQIASMWLDLVSWLHNNRIQLSSR